MRIIVAASSCVGSAKLIDKLVDSIKKDINENNKVDTFVLPYNNSGDDLAQKMALRLIDIKDECDVLITLDYPACMIEHRKKISLFTDFCKKNILDDKKNYICDSIKTIDVLDGNLWAVNGKQVSLSEEIVRL